MDKTLKMIMDKMECTEQEAKIILENVIDKNIVQNALRLAINKEYIELN